jgi:hypothetical protein
MRFDRFVELALYHPRCGYYTATRKRVGREPGTDFFTSTSSGPLFGELIASACVSLLPCDPAQVTFVELGAEPEAAILKEAPHPFRAIGSGPSGRRLDSPGDWQFSQMNCSMRNHSADLSCGIDTGWSAASP